MKITNRKGLSACWVKIAENDQYDKVGDYSCTTLIGPPRLYFLMKKYEDEIEQDVADMIWMIFGNAVHYLAETAAEKSAITEERFTFTRLGRVISMKPDRIELIPDTENYHLKDFKTTSVYSFASPLKISWVCQTNLYAYGARRKKINVTDISIEMLLKDWRASEARQNKTLRYEDKSSGGKGRKDYPDSPVQCVPVELWSDGRCEEFLDQRISLFKKCEEITNLNDLPFCSPQERWADHPVWKVMPITADGRVADRAMKGGSKFETEAEAKAFAKTKLPKKTFVKHVPGKSRRCEDYCPVQRWCNQYQETVCPDF